MNILKICSILIIVSDIYAFWVVRTRTHKAMAWAPPLHAMSDKAAIQRTEKTSQASISSQAASFFYSQKEFHLNWGRRGAHGAC